MEGAGLIRCQRRIKRVTQVMNDGALRRRHCLGTDLIWVGKGIDLLLNCARKRQIRQEGPRSILGPGILDHEMIWKWQ